ncbi:protein LNK2-like isoform X2 [Juglans microcarpa x Juglans regia]|uniref:protein LNK2-like isoform X2 n=1 Tax=Juglans microcarpa x Juglans regia TaxID=2249226 RepID=UPI001B7E4F99|nr:protein LNK2-like isoform X2 [Juglans microcarpa x Juglans regia]
MFDWNDEELAIIWGEGGESGDHIVPYPEASQDFRDKKDCNQRAADIKPTEQRTAGATIDLHGRKLESGSDLDTNANNAAKTDQDFMDSTRLDNDAETFQNTHEDREQGDFVGYEWANIGSFDDFDRIFSNDDPIFGHSSIGNADAQWSSSKDVANSPVKNFPISVDSTSLESGELRNSSEQLEIKSKYLIHDDQSLPFGRGKFEDASLHDMQNAHAISDPMEYAGNKRKPMVKERIDMDMVEKTSAATSRLGAENVVNTNEFTDKGSRQTKLLKCRRKSGKNEGKTLSHLNGTLSPSRNPSRKFESQFAPSMLHSPPSSMLGQQRQLPGDESLQYGHVANPFVAPSACGNIMNPYPAMPVHALIQPEQKHQPLLSGYDGTNGCANPVSKSVNTHVKPLTMTPQEKIEKLRRRQQIQAMLAIQKQQQQFSHQVPNTNNSITQRCLHESQTQHFEEADLEVEDISTTMDPNSPVEQDDSNTVYAAVDYSVDRILSKLQDTISKLDVKLRLCIRDSLFRLAQSAMQRHYASDASSNNKSSRDEDKVIAKDANSGNRYSGMPDVETVTNPIDRTLAHLLFHSPLESPGKLPDTAESPMSAKLPCKHKVPGSVNLSKCTKSKQNFPHQGAKNPYTLSEPHQLKNSPCTNTSENASNIERADGGAMEVEASK